MVEIREEGLKDLIKQMEELCTYSEIEKADRAALKKCGEKSHGAISKLIPRSKYVYRSGRQGSRTFEHAADNIPMKIKKVKGVLTLIIGWDSGDVSSYFYMKFIEFGTSQMPPQAPFKKIFIKDRSSWNKIFEEEYTKLIESRLR